MTAERLCPRCYRLAAELDPIRGLCGLCDAVLSESLDAALGWRVERQRRGFDAPGRYRRELEEVHKRDA